MAARNDQPRHRIFNSWEEDQREKAKEAYREALGTGKNEDQPGLDGLLRFFHQFQHRFQPYVSSALPQRAESGLEGYANPKKRYYPRVLRPWSAFLGAQDEFFNTACQYFGHSQEREERAWDQIGGFRYSCETTSTRMKTDYHLAQEIVVQAPTTGILSSLHGEKSFREAFQLPGTLKFSRERNRLCDGDREVQYTWEKHIKAKRPKSKTYLSFSSSDDSRTDAAPEPKILTDLSCMYQTSYDDDYEEVGTPQMRLIANLKLKFRIPIDDLRQGFREMDAKKDILEQPNFQKYKDSAGEGREEDQRASKTEAQYNADHIAAALATENFHYMVQNGVLYSFISTKEATILLHIEKDDPTTLYYHVAALPGQALDDDPLSPYYQTAVGQALTICFLAWQTPQRNLKWRQAARKQLQKCESDGLRKLSKWVKIKKEGSPPASASPSYQSQSQHGYNLRRLPGRAGSPGPSADTSDRDNDPRASQADDGATPMDWPLLQYCTMKCLLGVTKGHVRDPDCPNAATYPTHQGKHVINRRQFRKLVHEQLAKDPDHNCKPLTNPGTTGALFQIRLASHVYVFIGKGTVKAYIPRLVHEGFIYEKLLKAQGVAVPVHLGNIYLDEKYYLHLGVKVRHMLLLSYGGVQVDDNEIDDDDGERVARDMDRAIAAINLEGVEHMDTWDRNLLMNDETGRVLVIDFERAVWHEKLKAKYEADRITRRLAAEVYDPELRLKAERMEDSEEEEDEEEQEVEGEQDMEREQDVEGTPGKEAEPKIKEEPEDFGPASEMDPQGRKSQERTPSRKRKRESFEESVSAVSPEVGAEGTIEPDREQDEASPKKRRKWAKLLGKGKCKVFPCFGQ